MKPSPFTYHDPRNRDDLYALLGQLDEPALLAGGQSLVPMLNLRLAAPGDLIDLNRVEGLAGLSWQDDVLAIGAMTRQADLHESPDVASHFPVMREALDHVGHFQTRSRGTLGGSCCHLDPAAELPAICALYDAIFVAGSAAGRREIAASDWFQGYLKSALREREILEAVRLRPWAPHAGYGFHEYARRHGDFAIAGAAALVERDEDGKVARAAVVVFGVAENPVRLRPFEADVAGRPAGADMLAQVESAARGIEAMSDAQISADYRSRLSGVMARRAFATALQRAGLMK